MTMNSWVSKNLGKAIDYDGAYGVQCVDLIKSFVDDVLGVKPQSIGNAIDYYNKRKTSKYLTDNFDWIDNTPDFIPQKGDVCVFTSKSGLGHISVATGEGTTSYFYSYDENYPTGNHEPMTKIKHIYASFLGVLRPKDQSNIQTSEKPDVKVGDTVTFSANKPCYKGYGNKSGRYLINELTAFTSTEEAVRKKGRKEKITELKTLENGNLWMQFTFYGKKVYVCIYDKKKNKKYIK